MYIYLYLCVYFFLIVLKEDQIEMKRLFYIPCITLKKNYFRREVSIFSVLHLKKIISGPQKSPTQNWICKKLAGSNLGRIRLLSES